jgi:hypothetical protein
MYVAHDRRLLLQSRLGRRVQPITTPEEDQGGAFMKARYEKIWVNVVVASVNQPFFVTINHFIGAMR